MPRNLLVTDFDGTLTRTDFYFLARGQLCPPRLPNYFLDYTGGRLTHFDCLALTYAQITATEAETVAALASLGLEPRLAEYVERLGELGWDTTVASAGCRWYIDRLVGHLNLPTHANGGHWHPSGRGLVMTRPADSPFTCTEVGIDKPAVVRDALGRAERVAYAGDGPTDVPALLLVPPELRFAKGDAAMMLREMGEGFVEFDGWAEVAEELI